MDIARFKKTPLLGILRGIEPEMIEPLAEAVVLSGLKTVEITMNSKNPAELIRGFVRAFDNQIMVGAGTVLSLESLKAALDAGATFVVMPTLAGEVMDYCVKNAIPVFPGALTPTEIYRAWNAGATMVKVFPSGMLNGPAYFKEVKAPFDMVELMACGGVTAENIRSYFSSGASAVAFGASIFRKEWLVKKDFKSVENAVKKLISSYGGKG